MSDAPPFLQALELGLDADERAVRRAYAQRLRAIDAEADPVGFQALRENFERALQWVARPPTARVLRGVPFAPDTPFAPPPPPAPVAPTAPMIEAAPALADDQTLPDQAELARAAFVDFQAAVARLTADAHARRHLDAALDDARLVNLDARAMFEAHVAHLLASGWQVGHEFLFIAACDVFGWETERRRLASFGRAGRVIDAAIHERHIFARQKDCAAQRTLMRRMRTDKPGTDRDLATEIPMLGLMLQRFPNWMAIMTSRAVVQHWVDAWNALSTQYKEGLSRRPGVRASPSGAASTVDKGHKPNGGDAGARVMIGGLLVVLVILGRLGGSQGSHEPRVTQPPYRPAYVATPPPAPPDWSQLGPRDISRQNVDPDLSFLEGPKSELAPLPLPDSTFGRVPPTGAPATAAEQRRQMQREAARLLALQKLANEHPLAVPNAKPLRPGDKLELPKELQLVDPTKPPSGTLP